MIKGNYSLLKDCDYILLYRVSTEFDKKTWIEIFKNMYLGDIRKIIFVPTGIDTWRDMFREMRKHWKRKLKRKNETLCGWLYSEKEFHDMWKDLYCIEEAMSFENTKMFF